MTREDWTYTTQYHTKLDVFEYYEWLEIREAIRKAESTYKKLIEQESLLSCMSKVIKVPSLQPTQRRRSVAAEGPTIRNETRDGIGADSGRGLFPPSLSSFKISIPVPG